MLHTDTFHHVSVIDTIKMLLENDAVFKQMFSQRKELTSGTYTDFCDGSFVQSHPILSAHSDGLQIIGYYDELETNNPLGPNVKKYKLGFVFFTIGNFHPKLRSTYKSVFLSTIVKYTLVEKWGIMKVLQPFVDDLNQLSKSGVAISRGGHVQTYKGALVAFLGDNLASHAVGGFKLSMSFARHFCRSCFTTKEAACKHFVAEDFKERTPAEHELQCSKVASDPSGKESTEYGINDRSVLDDVPGFSVVKGLCHDAFHDLLEGALNYELRLLLQHFFQSKYLSLSQFNDRLQSFDYGYSEIATKPNAINARYFKDESKIRYSASEMLLMTRILPFLVGDKVPKEEAKYICFLKLIEILQIALSPSVSDDTISYFRVLIEEHHTMFIEEYPSQSFIPKLHYLVHYPNQIRTHGPLIRAWTMRYEGKLSYFKQIARTCNYKNVTLTLANKHQRWLAYHLFSEMMFTPEVLRGPMKTCTMISEQSSQMQLLIQRYIPQAKPENLITSSRWITVNGIKYSTNNCYLISSMSAGEPNFSKVEQIVTINLKEAYLIMSKCDVLYYDSHLLSYAVNHTESLCIISASNIEHPTVLHSRKPFFQSQVYLSPNYFLSN